VLLAQRAAPRRRNSLAAQSIRSAKNKAFEAASSDALRATLEAMLRPPGTAAPIKEPEPAAPIRGEPPRLTSARSRRFGPLPVLSPEEQAAESALGAINMHGLRVVAPDVARPSPVIPLDRTPGEAARPRRHC
jgi:hypothetical protein